MKEKSNTDRKTGSNANLSIDTDEFIRQVSFAGKGENMPESVQTENQTDIPAAIPDMPEPAEEKPAKMKEENYLFGLDTLTGTWESVNLNPTVMIYKNGNTYLLSFIHLPANE